MQVIVSCLAGWGEGGRGEVTGKIAENKYYSWNYSIIYIEPLLQDQQHLEHRATLTLPGLENLSYCSDTLQSRLTHEARQVFPSFDKKTLNLILVSFCLLD